MINTVKIISFKNFLIVLFLIAEFFYPIKIFSSNFLNTQKKIQENSEWIQQIIYAHNSSNKNYIKHSLQYISQLFYINKTSYQTIKKSYTKQIKKSYQHINIHHNITITDTLHYKHKVPLKIYNPLINLIQKTPFKIISIKTKIDNFFKTPQYFTLQLKLIIQKLQKKTKLKFEKFKIKNYKESFQLHIPSFQKKNHYNNKLEIFQNAIYTSKTLPKEHYCLPKSIQDQLNINKHLKTELTQQEKNIYQTISQHKNIEKNILQVNKIYNNLIEQKKWLDKSPALKEILRAKISKLPSVPNLQKIDNNINQLRKKRLKYEYQAHKLSLLISKNIKNKKSTLTLSEKNFLKEQIITQHALVILLLNNNHQQIIELTKLKILCEKLQEELQKIQKPMYCYLFWVADIYPVTISYLSDIYQDLHTLFIKDTLEKQILSIKKTNFSKKTTFILIIFSAITSIGLYIITHKRYQKFLEYSNKFVGKINQDNFSFTLYNIWYATILALPIPIFWLTTGYILSNAWACPMFIAIGQGMRSTAFILWIFIVNFYFASPKGLFITYFEWPKKNIQKIFTRHYIMSFSIIILLTMILIIFNNYNEKEFYPTLGRLCFIILCIYLTHITKNLKNSKLPLYINKYNSSNNIINHILWNIMTYTPIITSIFCIFGYFFVAQELLIRLEKSLFIWILLLIIYHLVKRWIFIQNNHISLPQTKQKKIKQSTPNAYNLLYASQYQITSKKLKSNENNKKILNLNSINTQKLQLIRSIFTLVAILLTTVLWSELYSTFSFLENITLWDVTSTIKGVNNVQPITLNAFLIAILVIIITTKTVHNLPAFLELALLQYLNLTPSTRYAITTVTKYILMLLGSIIGCSLIGIEWSKIQWLIAALGVGLGFGLQEIFANFISGLIILFEKPIRIGDTITICNLTGHVTHINIRATTITDRDHKEIIIPNKTFITKQFTNWSLSDTITRVVLKIPLPVQIDAKKTTANLLKIIKNSTLVLKNPAPEVYLSDLQQGFPIFEIRIYVENTKLRMPVRHQIHLLITEYYQKKGIKLPYFLLHYIYNNHISNFKKFSIY